MLVYCNVGIWHLPNIVQGDCHVCFTVCLMSVMLCVVNFGLDTVCGIFNAGHVVMRYILGHALCREYFMLVMLLCGIFWVKHCVGNISC